MKGACPHPNNAPEYWGEPMRYLLPQDAARCAIAEDKVLWCLDSMMETIHHGQDLGIYTAEQANGMFCRCCDVHDGFKSCLMVVEQSSPAPFIIHLRTMLLVFCATFPFTIIG